MSRIDYTSYWTKLTGDTVGGIIDKWAADKPRQQALVAGQRSITWQELDRITDSLATALLELGLVKGDRLGILGPNHPEMLLSWFAAAKVGIIPVPLSVRYRRRELQTIVGDAGCKGLITIDRFGDFNFLECLEEIRPSLPTLQHLIVHHVSEMEDTPGLDLRELMATPPAPSLLARSRPASKDILVILYTSGTTGRPKGVVHTHDSLFSDSKSYLAEVHWLSGADVLLQSMPWFHMVGHQNFNNVCLLLGQKNVLMEQYSPEKFIDLIERERVTWLDGVPTMFLLPFSRVPDFARRDLSSVKFLIVCGFYCPPEQMKLIKQAYQADLIQVVGSTEAGSLLCTRRDDDEDTMCNTVGRPVTNKKLKLCDLNGQPVPAGQVGELCYQGPSCFQCYWQQPELTRQEVDQEGYWHSGDLGMVADQTGNIRFMGRSKDVIIRGGFNIYPAEIEAFLMQVPGVQSALLVGFPDKILGEKSCCYIMPLPGAPLDEEDIRLACRENLSDYKVPDLIRIVEALPTLPSGKVDRVSVKQRLWEEMGL